jgi:hypothetical protein
LEKEKEKSARKNKNIPEDGQEPGKDFLLPPLSPVISFLRSSTLRGAVICFTGLNFINFHFLFLGIFPLSFDQQTSNLWRIAKSLGAICLKDIYDYVDDSENDEDSLQEDSDDNEENNENVYSKKRKSKNKNKNKPKTRYSQICYQPHQLRKLAITHLVCIQPGTEKFTKATKLKQREVERPPFLYSVFGENTEDESNIIDEEVDEESLKKYMCDFEDEKLHDQKPVFSSSIHHHHLSQRRRILMLNGVMCVHLLWLIRCAQTWMWVDEKPFLLNVLVGDNDNMENSRNNDGSLNNNSLSSPFSEMRSSVYSGEHSYMRKIKKSFNKKSKKVENETIESSPDNAKNIKNDDKVMHPVALNYLTLDEITDDISKSLPISQLPNQNSLMEKQTNKLTSDNLSPAINEWIDNINWEELEKEEEKELESTDIPKSNEKLMDVVKTSVKKENEKLEDANVSDEISSFDSEGKCKEDIGSSKISPKNFKQTKKEDKFDVKDIFPSQTKRKREKDGKHYYSNNKKDKNEKITQGKKFKFNVDDNSSNIGSDFLSDIDLIVNGTIDNNNNNNFSNNNNKLEKEDKNETNENNNYYDIDDVFDNNDKDNDENEEYSNNEESEEEYDDEEYDNEEYDNEGRKEQMEFDYSDKFPYDFRKDINKKYKKHKKHKCDINEIENEDDEEDENNNSIFDTRELEKIKEMWEKYKPSSSNNDKNTNISSSISPSQFFLSKTDINLNITDEDIIKMENLLLNQKI